MSGATPVERGCGTRKQGGVYAEVGLSPFGLPLEEFFVCPPHEIGNDLAKSLGLKDAQGRPKYRGVRLLERDGVTHVLDVVGEQFYPNAADIIEEGRRFGFSRRCELSAASEYAKLSPRSRLMLAHPRGIIRNPIPYFAQWIDFLNYHPCPRKLEAHRLMVDEHAACKDFQMCAGLWWNDVTDGTRFYDESDGDKEARFVVRRLPSLEYIAACKPEGVEPEYALAIIASLPLTRIVIVDGEGADAKMEKVKGAGVPVERVGE
jgi:hypothetical protein